MKQVYLMHFIEEDFYKIATSSTGLSGPDYATKYWPGVSISIIEEVNLEDAEAENLKKSYMASVPKEVRYAPTNSALKIKSNSLSFRNFEPPKFQNITLLEKVTPSVEKTYTMFLMETPIDGFYKIGYTAGQLATPEDCTLVWKQKVNDYKKAEEFTRFVYNKCSSVRKRPGADKADYGGYGQVFKFNRADIELQSLLEVWRNYVPESDDEESVMTL